MSLYTFKIHAPQAEQVYLVGSFNEWDPTASPMELAAGGRWSLSMDLEPGGHEFKCVVDGAWCCEPGCDGPHEGCPGCVPNDMGTMNRVVEVPAPRQKQKRPSAKGAGHSKVRDEIA